MPLEFEIAPGRMIGGDNPCFVIAEIGQNHQGDMKIAKQMIQVAKDAGADCAKFQKSELEYKFNKEALIRPYNTPNSWGATYGEHKRYLEFSHEQYYELKAYADSIGILMTASGMDEKAVDFLDELGVSFLKVASMDTNNLPYLTHAAKKGRPMVISSGMQTLETMRKVYEIVKPVNNKFCILQCTSCYPLAPENVHLNVIKTYLKEFPDIPIGYSGHEQGLAITLGAVAMGAKVVERHITLDKSWKGSDHKASLDPRELTELISNIRVLEKAMGSYDKDMRQCEVYMYEKLGKTVVANTDIPAGVPMTLDMLTVKVAEPKGYPPELIDELIGKKLKSGVDSDESILKDNIATYS
ncbi:N-acetylneuraminate-9-phosphate synthase-like [Saccoglossus kowalevskii]|uniref:N-acetylneuraminate-9-phosphate synthase n=1 Tax=Saccoglossus kowalevskii TaxID=10224 RepID=A0A0U2USU6_SACKO|nr:PREDICTED: sialic acid synthase-like [Saccoglossus kowalevskii]ALR88686.1 sialic acid synthase-like 237 [Saccoglossus kowalevskii]